MFATERQNKIKQILLEYKRVDVSKLSNLFAVSEVTIRKDLEQLERKNLLIRTHGGAIINDDSSSVYNLGTEDEANLNEHRNSIGNIVPYLINDADLIFLGGGRTCLEVAKNLKSKHTLNVITNNLSAAIELAQNEDMFVVTTGGTTIHNNGVFTVSSQNTCDFLVNKYVDKAIITADGFSLAHGFSVQDELLSLIYRTVISQAHEIIICATSDKTNKNAMFNFSPLLSINKFVTDSELPDDFTKTFYEHNIQVFHSFNLQFKDEIQKK